jgi:putative chitinase
MSLNTAIAAAAPYANVSAWSEALALPMQRSGIVTPNRIAMFIGQVVEETGNFRLLSEDLYYTTAARIRQVWPSRFADAGEAAPFIGRAAALANHVYANRMGNGSEESGDGWKFRGRGLIQLTGRTLYQAFAHVEPRATDPDWLLTPAGAAASACWYWTLPGAHPSLNALADAWDTEAVTRRINGGMVNLEARVTLCERARAALCAIPSAPIISPAPDENIADALMDRFNPGVPT